MQAELVLDARNATGESPVWHAAEQALYWVDIPARQLHRLVPATGAHSTWAGDEMLACIAPRAGHPGQWIAGMESGLFAIATKDDGTLAATSVARATHAAHGMRFNDGRCDRQGRFWAGTMLMDMAAARAVGRVYRYQSDVNEEAALRVHFDEMIVPNGMAFSPDGRTMYLSDSHPNVQAVWAFDYDTATGTPHNRRLFVDMKPLPGRPDGAAVDADGCYWICGNDAGLVHRFTPDGRLDRSLEVPVKKPAMCAFGGAQLDTLYVTSIRPGGDVSDQPLAGGVFALRPGVQGVPEPACIF
ncbi:SMP-30/gluconolactonase/LRE family protein [Variovorax guangxiensis]|uniref:SMP-30/gluconolactonase/LRE family protein n=1 Tax=Variovorax guangxiensis TaxID=1775474 RepID=A0A502DU78_9BURK|nr:SMP-30/gluconolactonase/LRE family protein [Variovorax guangxiensis]RZI65248.1 MAG: SMP-30/gluconolactonase/LRE family protein [Variovorax sp.]TPG23325.1 SMP-30/gluconolactonase/LRE family protein [Variovorax ginsengisoli]TPG27872.1 SMP-30/gluconolactonase/LRE family protein [Variovorax guangxiensis]